MSKLSTADQQKVLQLGLDFRKGHDESKQVYIRDQLALIFAKRMLKMRLHPNEVGIHPGNRNSDEITASGVWIRGGKIIAGGFSYAAMRALYAFEDHPTKRHIAKHTIEVTNTDEFGTYDAMEMRVGPANWTHCNQFVNMVVARPKCSDPGIPCIDGRIDSEYINDGMYWRVFPSWVEEAYD